MIQDSFSVLYDSGRILRYHTADIPVQSVAEHSWGVAMIVLAIYPNGAACCPSRLVQAALTHDCAEAMTGDIPATAKWADKKLVTALERMEGAFNERHGLMYELSTREKYILKWADTFELCLYCKRQAAKGNQFAEQVLTRGLAYLLDLGKEDPFPTTEATVLYEQYFG